jgi:hypothetical protein
MYYYRSRQLRTKLTEVDSHELVFIQQFLQHSPVHLFYLILSLKIIHFLVQIIQSERKEQ